MNNGLSSPLSTPASRRAVQLRKEVAPAPAESWTCTSERGCSFVWRGTSAKSENPLAPSSRYKFQNSRFRFRCLARSGGPNVSTKRPNWSTVDDFDVLSRGRLPKTRANTCCSAAFTAVAVRISLPPIRRLKQRKSACVPSHYAGASFFVSIPPVFVSLLLGTRCNFLDRAHAPFSHMSCKATGRGYVYDSSGIATNFHSTASRNARTVVSAAFY